MIKNHQSSSCITLVKKLLQGRERGSGGPEASEDGDTVGEAEERAARGPRVLAAEAEAEADAETRPADTEAKRGTYGTCSCGPFSPFLTITWRSGTMGPRATRTRRHETSRGRGRGRPSPIPFSQTSPIPSALPPSQQPAAAITHIVQPADSPAGIHLANFSGKLARLQLRDNQWL